MTISTSRTLPALDADQAAVLDGWGAEALLLLGGPGTGKTTVLAHAAALDRPSGAGAAAGGAPLVLAASRTAASHLRNAVTAEFGAGAWQPTVTTVHALSRSLWRRFAERPQLRLLAAPEQEFRVRELLAYGSATRWPDHLRPALGTRGFAAQVRLAIARARQFGLDPEDLVAFGESAGERGWVGLGRFFAEYLDVLDAEGVLDYAELVHRARLLLAEPAVGAALAAEISAVLVDDFTELDPAQIRFVAAVAGGAPVLATGDPDSVATAFRGAAPRAVVEFQEVFATAARPARVDGLQRGHRLGPATCAALAGLRQRLPRPAGSSLRNLRATDAADSVTVLTCAGAAEQAAAVAAELARARLEGLSYGDMAVLVRSGRRQLGALVQALVAAGIPVEVAGDEIPLADAPAVRPLLLGLGIAMRDQVTPEEAVRLLTSPLGGFDSIGLRRLARQWRRTQPEAALIGLPQQLAAAVNEPGWLAGVDTTEAVKLRAVLELVTEARALVADGAAVDVVAWKLWQGTDWPNRLNRESFAGGALGSRADTDLDAVCAFFELAAEADRRGGAGGVRAFLAELAGQQIPADRERESRVRKRGVQVLTAHRARGREWELVVVAGVQEGLWPSGRRMSAVLDAGLLTPDGLTGRTEHRDQLAAERRLFHLACSRARRRLVVTATAGTEGEADAPSRFLAELGVAPQTPQPDAQPLSLGSLTAQLRRAATDPAEPRAMRSAAADELAWLADQSDASGRPLVPAADPANWWGVRELSSLPGATDAQVRLSPSQVTSVLTCPRRYFLSRQAGGEAGVGLAATLGSLIHLLVQQVVTEGLELTDLRSRLDEVWERLPFGARWLSASERVEVELALQRFLNWRAARKAELIGVEVPFALNLTVGGYDVLLEGKVDWLERTADGLRVVDFKTSRSQPTKAEIAGLEQLGVYQLAIDNGGFDARGAGSVGAAAVYLRQAGRPEDVPKEFGQESLKVLPHLSTEPAELAFPTWVHHRVAAAAAVVAEGSYPATPGAHCRACVFATSCPASERGRQVAQ
ncbi:MAG TPA: ATP-dependent DNA helicase [Propionicimonas sp.]|nr:ATP-dependent DNA helicase [Propionicimonas sp.]HQD95877.1 ATP-dependent DNA helicase [Propionicimonas sp.]